MKIKSAVSGLLAFVGNAALKSAASLDTDSKVAELGDRQRDLTQEELSARWDELQKYVKRHGTSTQVNPA